MTQMSLEEPQAGEIALHRRETFFLQKVAETAINPLSRLRRSLFLCYSIDINTLNTRHEAHD